MKEVKAWFHWERRKHMGNGTVYGLGIIGAAVYFIQHSDGFWMGVLGVLKAIVWPAMVVYKVLGLLAL
jgi:hypothetical protein